MRKYTNNIPDNQMWLFKNNIIDENIIKGIINIGNKDIIKSLNSLSFGY